MTIRINPYVVPDLLAAIALDQQQQNTAIQQISTGKSVNSLSDNPAAATDVVFNHIQASQNSQYLLNITDLTPQLQTGEAAVNSAVTALTQAISLGIEGANGTLSAANQQQVATQVIGIRDQILSLANQTYQGNYVFAGTATSTLPFVLNSALPGGVQYNGNSGVDSLDIAQGSTIAINVPGSQIFTNSAGNVIGSLNGLITALQTNTGISAAVTTVQQAFSHLNSQSVFYGNALTQLNSTQNYLSNSNLQLASQENSLIGVDLATAATNLSQSTLAVNAVLAATNQILSTLNLLSYLK